ncbi:AbrB family transcriptional regulator [Mesorhizobium sp. Mes31]|uniref:AbrB family transcriptional regulator n=1 Tax=Mesorhizobium sp. Mes31 TaxID=2926017 RepID=UPI002118A378|nr:AbrB family transcriptional regulator [Mesorhizobium sp. Mes31]
MIGTALSRWTMSYFTVALVFLVAAQMLMVAGYGFPAVAAEAPETLVLVHMVTIGWLSMLMCGALFQFVPVLIAQPLRGERLVLPALICLLTGLAFLLAGFLQLAGVFDTGIPLLALAGTLLPAGFLLVCGVLGGTLWRANLQLPARFVAVGLVCVLVTAILGALFALLLSGYLPALAVIDFRVQALPVHIAIGLGGWLSFTAIGVSYRLLPMFMLSPDRERATSRVSWWIGVVALLLTALTSPIAAALEKVGLATGSATALALALAIAALVLYGLDLSFFYRLRKRRAIELNSRAAQVAFLALALSGVLLLALLATGTLERHVGALLYLVAFGWLTGLGLSQLYKIVPFLTWLEYYGPVMGKKPTPRVQDLVIERRGWMWFALYFLGVMAGTATLLGDQPGLFRAAAAVTLLATLAIVVELVLARRLANVPPDKRLPEGASRPRLFLPTLP